MGSPPGIFIHLQHFGQQYDRRGTSGQGDVTGEKNPETVVRHSQRTDTDHLPVPRDDSKDILMQEKVCQSAE